MILQNERVQLQMKVAVLRYGMEAWRDKAEELSRRYEGSTEDIGL
jgi:hypothetical protein